MGRLTLEGACRAAVDPVLKSHHRARPYKRHRRGPKEADAIIAAGGGWHNLNPKEAAG
jgi:glucose-6-phosphate 1-dehydrogenase